MHTLIILLLWLLIIVVGTPVAIFVLVMLGFIIMCLVGLIFGAIVIIKD